MRLPCLLFVAAFCLNAPVTAQEATICPLKMNVLYIGVENPVSLRVDGTHCARYSISGEEMTIIKQDDCDYLLHLTGGPGVRRLYVVNAAGAIIDSIAFRVKRIPDPVAKIGGKAMEGQPVLQTAPGLMAVLENFDFDAKFAVIDFEISVRRAGNIIFQKKNSTGTGYFSDEVKRIIDQIRPGDKVFFTNIRAKGPDNSVRTLNKISIVTI